MHQPDASWLGGDAPGAPGAPAPAAAGVIVAAGRSSRMGGRDKLEAALGGRSVLRRAIESMAAASSVRQLVLVTAPERVADLASTPWVRSLGCSVVPGGLRRQDSVAAGVAATDAELLLIHDGARPLVSAELVDRVAAAAAQHGAAVPVVPVVETLKRVTGGLLSGTVSRDDLYRAQTPQGVRREILIAAYRVRDPAAPETYTDEAALLEAHGVSVAVVPGDVQNLKITSPADLALAQALVRARSGPTRVGHGTDVHSFGPEDGLCLGGIAIPEAPRLAGHSDGDVCLHALADALLGAAGLPDLGRLFPAGEPGTRGIASSELVAQVVERLAEQGWWPVSADLTIVGARPRLGPARLEQMRAAIAQLLSLDPGAIGMKASTGNLSGDEGAGRAISALAIASVARS